MCPSKGMPLPPPRPSKIASIPSAAAFPLNGSFFWKAEHGNDESGAMLGANQT